MGSPVVIDDGGSTRIKQLKDHARMDDLMGTQVGGEDVFQGIAADPFADAAGFKCLMKVRYHDYDDAEHHIVPTGGLDLLRTDVITITSKNGQIATITFDATNRLIITLTSTPGKADPMVDTKKDGKLRRYVVINAGPIQTVEVARAAGGIVNPIYNAALNPSMYTMVFFK
jgi:hypothetical protein